MISRKQFIQAIQAGIAASPLLSERQRDALRQVAVSSKHTGNNFNSGCPWAQAFGSSRAWPEEGLSFAIGYDKAILSAGYGFDHPVID